MEFVGDGIKNLSMDYRIGIDVMTTETTCLSSIWITDDVVKEYYEVHNRPDKFKYLEPERLPIMMAWYMSICHRLSL